MFISGATDPDRCVVGHHIVAVFMNALFSSWDQLSVCCTDLLRLLLLMNKLASKGTVCWLVDVSFNGLGQIIFVALKHMFFLGFFYCGFFFAHLMISLFESCCSHEYGD